MRKKFLPFVVACCCAVTSFGQASYCNKVIGGYVTDWEDVTPVNFNQLTHAFIAFIGSDKSGNLCTYEASGSTTVTAGEIDVRPETKVNFQKYIDGANAAHCKKILSIGGYGCDEFMNGMAEAGKVGTFVTNLVAFVNKYNFDGVDLDWEQVETAANTANYRTVCSAVSDAMKANKKLLFCTVVTGYYAQFFPYDAVQKADYVQLMAYDQTATWDTSPAGNHSTIDAANTGISLWSGHGIATSKMILGLPFYGYQQKNSGGNKTADWTWKAFYTQYKTDADNYPVPGTSETIGLNGTATIKAKTDIGYNQLAGVMVWEMQNDLPYTDPKSLHLALIQEMQRLCPSGHGNTAGVNEIKTKAIATSYYSAQLNQVRVSLQKQGRVKVSLYNVLGQQVLASDLGTVVAGDYGVDLDRAAVKGGVYIVTVSVNDERVSSKIYIQ